MAKATKSRSSDQSIDAIELLKQDHRAVEALFEEFEEAEDEQLAAIAERVCQLLTVHAQIEEELLYPAAKEAFKDEEENDLVNEATVEHASARELIAQIEDMSADDELFKATVKVLSEYIKHHVKEEEGEMFPKLKETELDLEELGGRLQDRKLALMEEVGIEPEEDEGSRKHTRAAAPTSNGARTGRASRQ